MGIRIGICVFLVLIFTGGTSYFYSTQVTYTYPVTTPITQYTQVQKSRIVPALDRISVQDTINPQSSLYFGWYNTPTIPFNGIAFNISGTATTWITVKGTKAGIVWGPYSIESGQYYVDIKSSDSYRIEIYNPSSSSAVYASGFIELEKTEYYWETVPYTTYQTTYETRSNTDYPHRSLGMILIFVGILTGIGTGTFFWQNKRRMKEIGIQQIKK